MSKLFSEYKQEASISFFIATILHFLVDFISVSTIVSFYPGLGTAELMAITILYDFLAFATQPVIGVLADIFHEEKYLTFISIILLGLGFFMPFKYVAMVLVGIGNALFHVFAGKTIIDETDHAAPLGVFISTGTLGLSLALGYANPILRYCLLALLLVFGSVYPFLRVKEEEQKASPLPNKKSEMHLLPLIAVAVAVLIRAMLGNMKMFEADAAEMNVMLVALFVFLGKAIGGFIVDLWGGIILIAFSTVIGCLSIIGLDSTLCRIAFLLAVNLPMGFTLYYAKKSLPSFSGFGFGVLAALLLLGMLLVSYPFGDLVSRILSVVFFLINASLCIYTTIKFKSIDKAKGGAA